MTLAQTILADIDTMLAGDSAVITHGGVATAVTGTYENEYVEIDVATQTVQSARCAFYCKTTDVPNADHSDTLSITSVLHGITATAFGTVKVQKSPPDLGPGLTRFVLKRT